MASTAVSMDPKAYLDIRPFLLEPAKEFHAAHARHLQIGEHEISRRRLKLLQRFFGASCATDLILLFLEERHQSASDVQFVIDDENAASGCHDLASISWG
jgi:hypothetical protein